MSTLTSRQGGLERALRGLELLVQGVYSGVTEARHAATQRTARGFAHTNEASHERLGVSLIARLRAELAQRRSEREFAALMREDPRLRADYLRAKARAEWNR